MGWYVQPILGLPYEGEVKVKKPHVSLTTCAKRRRGKRLLPTDGPPKWQEPIEVRYKILKMLTPKIYWYMTMVW